MGKAEILGVVYPTLGSFTPNYSLYMPSVGETGWGSLVSLNFSQIDSLINDSMYAIKNGTLITKYSKIPNYSRAADFNEVDNLQYITSGGYQVCMYYVGSGLIIPPNIPMKLTTSCRYWLIYIDGDFTLNGVLDSYPTTLQAELPPGTPETNTFDVYQIGYRCSSLTTEITDVNGTHTIDLQLPYYGADEDFVTKRIGSLPNMIATIPHAIAAGGAGNTNVNPGTSGTASNTCNGGGGNGGEAAGGTGCIFGQYLGGGSSQLGFGYGSISNSKYRCAIIFVVNGNFVNNGTIIMNGGNGSRTNGGYGGGGGNYDNSYYTGGGGGAPVFIYYTGTYTNNGTINTAGGNGYNVGGNSGVGGNGGAGGIKTTQITIS